MGLQSSIAIAAMKNPSGVLKLVDTGKNLEAAYICMPFMQDETDPKRLRKQLNILARLEHAFGSVHVKELEKKKNECLAQILPLKQDLEVALTPGLSRPR